MFFKKRHFLILITLTLWLVNSRTTGMSYNVPNKKLVTDTANKVFLKLVVSKPSVYKGEPFVVRYILYNAVSVIDPGTNADLKFPNCYQEEYPPSQKTYSQTIKGIVYTVVVLKQFLVIPSNVGKLALPRLKIQLKMDAVAKDDFFGTVKEITTELTSNTTSVMVRDIPKIVDTAIFSGGIGNFKITGEYKHHKKIKNMVVFLLTIDGIGNTKATSINVPSLPVGLESYNINTTRKDTLVDEGIKTHLEYSFQVVANYKGEYNVPPVTVNVFDPKKNEYVNYTSPSYPWSVSTGPVLVTQSKTQLSKELNDLFIENMLKLKNYQIFSSSGLFIALMILGLLILVYCYRRTAINKFVENYYVALDAKWHRYQTLKSIQKLIVISPELDDDTFCKKLVTIFYKFIQKEISANNTKISNLALESNLFSKNILPEDAYKQIVPFLNKLNIIRFSAVHVNSIDKLQSCNQLIAIVKTVDGKMHE